MENFQFKSRGSVLKLVGFITASSQDTIIQITRCARYLGGPAGLQVGPSSCVRPSGPCGLRVGNDGVEFTSGRAVHKSVGPSAIDWSQISGVRVNAARLPDPLTAQNGAPLSAHAETENQT